MSCNSKSTLFVAAAGAGKTTMLIRMACEFSEGKVLFVTYTDENTEEITQKFYELNHGVPAHVSIKPWFTFLLEQYIRPYQSVWTQERISGIEMVQGTSGLVTYDGRMYHSQTQDKVAYYVNASMQVYSDKLSKMAIETCQKTDGAILERLCRAYQMILVDEVQDMVGYDLDVLKQISETVGHSAFAGDPRQDICETHQEPRNKKYSKGKIVEFFRAECPNVMIDMETLSVNHRCRPEICDFSNRVFPELPSAVSDVTATSNHDGLYFVKESDIDEYLARYRPVQLRHAVNTKRVRPNYKALNFGKAKGHAYDDVLIFPTEEMRNWLNNNHQKLADGTRSKLYVAITRARNSVAFVVPDKFRYMNTELKEYRESESEEG